MSLFLYMHASTNDELAFFLPQQEALQAQWGRNRNTQQTEYASLCVNAANRIALVLQDALGEDNHVPAGTLEKLWLIACEERRHIAKAQKDKYGAYGLHKYGTPIHHDMGCVMDVITAAGTRYAEYAETCHAQFNPYLIRGKREDDKQEEYFGKNYHRTWEITKDDGQRILTIENFRYDSETGSWFPLSYTDFLPGRTPHASQTAFSHTSVTHRDQLFRVLNNDLNEALTAENEPERYTALGNMMLSLFQGNQSTLGGQTVNLILLAGILKGMGYALSPMLCETDHFLDAELFKPDQYVQKFHKRFSPPLLRTHPPLAYHPHPTPDVGTDGDCAGKLEAYLRDATHGTSISRALRVVDVYIYDGTLMAQIHPAKYQEGVDRLLSWIGPQLIHELALNPRQITNLPDSAIRQRYTTGYLLGDTSENGLS